MWPVKQRHQAHCRAVCWRLVDSALVGVLDTHSPTLQACKTLLTDQNRRLVMLVDEKGNVTPRIVRPGPKIDGYRIIRSGLDGTETIVIEGLVRARPGAVVTPELIELPLMAAE